MTSHLMFFTDRSSCDRALVVRVSVVPVAQVTFLATLVKILLLTARFVVLFFVLETLREQIKGELCIM